MPPQLLLHTGRGETATMMEDGLLSLGDHLGLAVAHVATLYPRMQRAGFVTFYMHQA